VAASWPDVESAHSEEISTMAELFPEESLECLRLLYVSNLVPDYYGEYRLRALRRLGLGHVAAVDTGAFTGLSGLAGKLQFRLQAGPDVTHLNHAILQGAEREQANVLLCDKVLSLRPATLRKLRQSSVVTVDFVIDDPFGPRRDPGWRLYRRTIAEFDLTGVQRDVSIADYRQRGAREVVRIRTSYEPTVHYPPPVAAAAAVYSAEAPAAVYPAMWSDLDRDRQVSFIGTPYDNRGDFLTRLWRAGVPVDVSGSRPHWQAALPPDVFAAVFRVGELKGAAYREAIWRSRINLAFITHSNRDQVAHKSFEITACGGFLLAERTPEHLACFREDEEAVFFSDLEECRAKIDRYLNDEPARARIAAAGQRRAHSSVYDNDSVLRRLLGRAAELLAARSSR
jgi:spore maturation protein CgeB